MGPQLTLHIGGQRLCFRGHNGLRIQPPAWAYADFISSQPGFDSPADIEILVKTGTPEDGEPMQIRFDTGDAWRLSARGQRRRIEMIPRDTDAQPHWCADTTLHCTEVELYCAESLLDPGQSEPTLRHLVQYPLDQILLVQHLLGAGKGLLLHAAGAIYQTDDHCRGFVFAGISGAGKSTLSQQLKSRPDWQFLSDDRIVTLIQDHQVEIHGTPWPGDASVALNQHCRLDALCFLRQSGTTALKPLTSAAALEYLLPVASIPWYDRAQLHNALDLCAQLLASVPVYELHFQRQDPELTRLLESFAP